MFPRSRSEKEIEIIFSFINTKSQVKAWDFFVRFVCVKTLIDPVEL
jgi:hypothetical protein